MQPSVHCSTVYNSQDMEAPECLSKEEWMKMYICTMECYATITKNEIMPLASTWIDLEIVILSDVSQRRGNIV